MTRLRATAARFPKLVSLPGELLRHLPASVGGRRVGVLQATRNRWPTWRLALEAVEPGDPLVRRQVGWQADPSRWRMAAWMALCW
jgi:hypothetical protein